MKTGELVQLLPGIFQRTVSSSSPLMAMLAAMEALHAPAEDILKNIDSIFDPNRTLERFVPLLARWVDLEQIFLGSPELSDSQEDRTPISTGLGRLRQLTSSAAWLSKWRGTCYGLQRFLEIATGVAGFNILENSRGADGKLRPFHIVVVAPASLNAHRPLLDRIIEVERPAYATWELTFDNSGGSSSL
jgi:phage tail-like protein